MSSLRPQKVKHWVKSFNIYILPYALIWLLKGGKIKKMFILAKQLHLLAT
uniref:Uncharacterized protein n=1 Tax=Anguilla anguilla TaxID=7936 RepID=A0A0E9QD31_ANGAN